MKLVADNVQGVIVPGRGHWLAEQEPQQLVDVLTPFLALYRDAELRPFAMASPTGQPTGSTPSHSAPLSWAITSRSRACGPQRDHIVLIRPPSMT